MANRNSIVLVNDTVVRGMPIYIHDMVKKNFGQRVPLRNFTLNKNSIKHFQSYNKSTNKLTKILKSLSYQLPESTKKKAD